MGPSLEFGVVDDQVVVGTGGGIEDLVTEPAASLADDPQFQAVMDVLPSEYYQVSYVDIGQAVDVLTAMLGAMERVARPARGRVSRRPARRGQPGEHPGTRGGLLPTGRGGRIERDPVHRGASVLT